MEVLLDRRGRTPGTSPPTSTKRTRILPDKPARVEVGQIEWQSDCHFCNRNKGPNLAGIDKKTRDLSKLYHPRLDRWDDHFQWRGPRLRGLTPTGRVTIQVMAINDPLAVALRRELIREGVFPPRT